MKRFTLLKCFPLGFLPSPFPVPCFPFPYPFIVLLYDFDYMSLTSFLLLYNEETAAKQKSCKNAKKSFGMGLTEHTSHAIMRHVNRTHRSEHHNEPPHVGRREVKR